jgi:RNase P/RNase MRP subunit POP5
VFDGGKAGLMSVKYNPEKLTGIIRVSNKYVDKLKVCLGLIKNINNQNITLDCIYVSGMLNKAAEKMDN